MYAKIDKKKQKKRNKLRSEIIWKNNLHRKTLLFYVLQHFIDLNVLFIILFRKFVVAEKSAKNPKWEYFRERVFRVAPFSYNVY